MTVPTASPLTRWPGCIAIWTSCISSGVKARSPHPFPSHPWSSGRTARPLPSTGFLQLVGLCMTGERGACHGLLCGLCDISYVQGEGCNVRGDPGGSVNMRTTAWGTPPSPQGSSGLSHKPMAPHACSLLGEGPVMCPLQSVIPDRLPEP